MHYMRRRFQKGKGLMNPRAKGVTSEDVMDFPLLGLLAGASWVTDKVAHSKRKKTIKTKREKQKRKKRHYGPPVSD